MFVSVMQNQVQLEEEKWGNLSLGSYGMQEFVHIQIFIINQQLISFHSFFMTWDCGNVVRCIY